ncbi:MAG: CPBP family intramembrane metalloprotease, partial [Dehalococcoidia bacterium]|nr:CPBP family intramembrane metalloprotease [Dehalococcoidia bacterium]
WAWIRWYERRPFASLGLTATDPILATARGVVTGVGMFSAGMALMALLGGARVAPTGSDGGIAAIGGVALMVVVFGARALAEEALCRGWVLPVMGVQGQPAIGVAVATLIYVILDSDNVGGNAIALVNVTLAGVLLCLFALNDGHIYGAIGWNLGWNWAQRNLLYLPRETGFPTPGGAFLTFEALGDPTISGGSAGAEGSLAITTVLALALIMLITYVSQPPPSPRTNRRSR